MQRKRRTIHETYEATKFLALALPKQGFQLTPNNSKTTKYALFRVVDNFIALYNTLFTTSIRQLSF